MVRTGERRVREAKRLYDGCMARWVSHYHGCYACYVGVRDGDTMRYCEAGWHLAKLAQAAYAALAHARGEDVCRERGEQLALF
jgi:hypothetical protein